MVQLNAPLTQVLKASIAIERMKRENNKDLQKVKAMRERLKKIINETL